MKWFFRGRDFCIKISIWKSISITAAHNYITAINRVISTHALTKVLLLGGKRSHVDWTRGDKVIRLILFLSLSNSLSLHELVWTDEITFKSDFFKISAWRKMLLYRNGMFSDFCFCLFSFTSIFFNFLLDLLNVSYKRLRLTFYFLYLLFGKL